MSDPRAVSRLGPGPCILCPILAGLGPELADVAAALPIGDANARLLTALEAAPDATKLVAGVFANDPFRPRDDVFAMAAARNVAAVANWPSVALLSGELAEQLSCAGYTFANEMAMLEQARRRGLSTVAFACTEEQARDARRASAAMIVVAPLPAAGTRAGLDAGAATVLRSIDALRRAPGREELRVYRHPAYGERLAEAARHADGTIGFGGPSAQSSL